MTLINRFTSRLVIQRTTEDDHVSDVRVPGYVVVPYRVKGRMVPPTSIFQPSSSSRNRVNRIVHGVCQLPSGYALRVVPPRSQIVELDEDQQGGGAQLDNNKLSRRDTTDHKEKDENTNQGGGETTAIFLYSRFKTQISSRWASRRTSSTCKKARRICNLALSQLLLLL